MNANLPMWAVGPRVLIACVILFVASLAVEAATR